MANNRLYIGNKETKQYILFCKSLGSGWHNWTWTSMDNVIDFIEWDSQDVGEKTNLVFFTEYDEIYDWFMDEGKRYDTTAPGRDN